MKREKKKLTKRQLELFENQLWARYGWLSVEDMEFDKRMRNKALKMAKNRRVGYIQ